MQEFNCGFRGTQRTALAVVVTALLTLPVFAGATEHAQVRSAVQQAMSLPLDPVRLNPAAAAADIGGDEGDLLAWMHANFAVDAYEGRLRGVRGTMFSRSGNPLELSLLLGAMLESRGVEWRLAEADLAGSETDLFSLFVDEADFALGGTPDSVERYQASRDTRRAALVRQHVWVQARVAGSWVDLDPSLPLGPGESLTEATRTVSASERVGTTARTATIQVHYRSTGTDGGVILTRRIPLEDAVYRNLSVSLRRDITTGQMLPALEFGDIRESGQRFSSRGLRKVWVEVIIDGWRTPRTWESVLFHSDEPSGGTLTDNHVQLSVLVLTGRAGTDWTNAVIRTLATDLEPMLAALGSAGDSDAIDAEGEELFASLAPGITGVLALTFAHRSDRLTDRIGRTLGVRPWWSEPRVLVASLRRTGSHAVIDLDLVDSRPEGVVATGLPPLFAGAFHVLRGSMEASLHETLMTGLTPDGSWPAGAPSMNADWQSASNPQSAVLSGDQVPRVMRTFLRDLLGRENLVAVIPVGAEPGPTVWLVDAGTGNIVPLGSSYVRSPGARQTATAPSDSRSATSSRYASLIVGLLNRATADLAGRADDNELMCAAQCRLNHLAPRVCRGDDERPTINVTNCLSPATDGATGGSSPVASIRVTRGGCYRSAQPAICGALMSNLAMSGRLVVERSVSAPLGGQWAEVQPITLTGRCSCD